MPRIGQLGGLTGLTANDRSTSDKQALQTYSGEDFMVASLSTNISSNRQYFQNVHDTNAIMANTYQDYLQEYRDKYHVGDNNIIASTSNIQDVAYKVSPYFKKYIGSDYLDLNSKDWARLAAQYEATRDVYGEDAANKALDGAIMDNVAKNQPWYEQAYFGFLGLGAFAAGAIVSTVGAIKGMVDYFDGAYEDKNYLSGWENFMNSVMDNDWTRYGNDVVQYGSLRPDNIARAKELGISELQIVESQDQQNSLFSAATPWVALQQDGFTLASIIIGYGEAKIAGWMFKGLKGAAIAGKTGQQLMQARNLLTKIQKAENFTNKFIIPGMTGTTEGLVEGLSTKQQAEEDGINYVTSMHQQEVANEVNNRLSNYTKVEGENGVTYLDKDGNPVDIDSLYSEVWKEFEPKYKEALDQVDYTATRAGINNFYVNSAINGLINSTLKAGLQAPTVRKALQNTKLYGWAQPLFRDFDVSGENAASAVVKPKFGWGKMAWTVAKEPLGEFTEEYLQSVSDATMRGGAENNIHQFVENKYHGDGSAAVGDYMSGDIAAAWTALNESLTDFETVKSGVMGAVSSVMGTPFKVSKARTGRLNADGSAETTLFGRGLNERGERESNWERIQRLTPWRSGLIGSIREARAQRAEAEETAETLQEWLRDPDNKAKFDGLVGTFNWAREIGDAARGSDEFGYRNSTLGKTINDIFMLSKLKGTQYYDTYMNQLAEIANLEEGSEAATQYVQSMKDNINTDSNTMSDEEILSSLKKNANQMLTTIDKVQQESDNVEKLLGNVDEDTKQSLIYGQMMLEDWQKRSQQLKEELGKVNVENSVEHSINLNSKQKEILATYGSFANARKELDGLEKKITTLQEDIKNLNSRKNLTENEEKILRQKKANLKTAKKSVKELEAIKDIEEGTESVLSEEEIMALDPISRAIMLRNGKERTYVTTHGGKERLSEQKKAIEDEIEQLERKKSKHLNKKGQVKSKSRKGAVNDIQKKIDDAQKRLDALSAEEKPYFSDAQQAVIDNLVAKGTTQDRGFLDKVIDAGRIENSTQAFLQQYNSILTDPDSFSNYVARAKQAAADIATKGKWQALNNMQDYGTFAKEMDKVYNEGSVREQMLITRKFRDSDNPNYDRYVNERNLISDLVKQVSESDEFKNISDNDADMFVNTLTYLSDKGVDFNDQNAVVRALSEVDKNGVSEFQKYVDDVNSALPEIDRVAFTSIGEAIQTFNDVMSSYKRDQQERESNSRPIVPTSTTSEQSAPVPAPEPVTPQGPTPSNNDNGGATVNPFEGIGSSTPEGGYMRPDGTPIGTVEVETQGGEVIQPDSQDSGSTSVIDAFRDNSNDEVAKAAETALNIVKNALQGGVSNESREDARQFIEGLSNNSFDTVDEFIDAITASANARDAKSESGADEVSNLLRQVTAKINLAKVDNSISNAATDRRGSSFFDRRRRQIDKTAQRVNSTYNMFPNATTSSSFIASINIDNIRQRFPNSSTVKYYDKYGIEDALRNDILSGNPDILFITDEELTNGVANDMGSAYSAEVALPIVAVVESKNGPITIDGKNYQPISVMASTNKEGSAGSTHMAPIRSLALKNKGTQIVRADDGRPIVTKPYGTPKAYPVDLGYRGRNSVIDVGIEDLSADERTQLQATEKSARRNNPSYQKMKRNFLSKLGVRTIGSRKGLFFGQTRMNNTGDNPIEVFVSPISESTARNSDSTFAETVASNDEDALINFNSRTARTAKALGKFLGTFSTDEMIFDMDANGQIIPTPSTKGTLSGIASSLGKSIDNFINIPISKGWSYSISPTMEVVGDNRVMSLDLVNTNGETIHLTNIHQGMTEGEIKSAQTNFLRNLIMDGDEVRMTDSTNSFAKWNVPYNDVTKMAENKGARDNINDIYDDGILAAAATTFNYRIQGIAVHNPFRADGTPAFTQTANATNAQAAAPVNTPTITSANQVVTNGAVVDSNTGTVLEGTPATPTNPAQENAKRIVGQIEEDSKHIRLSDDGSSYIDDRTGVRHARVTSVISADEQADNRFDPNSPWALPSTNIGTGFDEFVRDFFAGKVESMSIEELKKNYPNATGEALYKFIQQLQVMKNSFIASGLTIVPRDVTVTGSLDVADSNGNVHTVEVAGTLDLLAYDANGNFYVFDMKTNRSGIDEHKREKYSRQLSLYKKFLENKYGVKVVGMNLIPIKVDYPAPTGVSRGTADYTLSQEKPNQLLIDGKDFVGANPKLEELIPINYKEPHIVWGKMTDAERAMFGGVEETVKAETENSTTPAEAIVSEPAVPTEDPILGVQFDDSYLSDMFGDDSIGTSDFSMDFNERTAPIPDNLKWENLTSEQRDALEMMGFNETSWSNLEDDEMEHKLKCLE